MQHKTVFDRLAVEQKAVIKEHEAWEKAQKERLKPLVEEAVLALGYPVENTVDGFRPDTTIYSEFNSEEYLKKINSPEYIAVQAFVGQLAQDYNISFYFGVFNGTVVWCYYEPQTVKHPLA